MYVIVLGISAIVLGFERPPIVWLRSAGAVLLAVVAAIVLPTLIALWVRHRVLTRLDAQPGEPALAQRELARGQTLTTASLGLLHAAVLCATGWLDWPQRLPGVGGWPVVPSILALVPFLLTVLLVWAALYPADRAIRQIAVEVFLMRGRPVRPPWSLRSYLMFNLRHQVLFVLVPMLLIVLARDLIEQYEDALRACAIGLAGRRHAGIEYVPDLAMGAAAGLVALIAPVLLRYIWITEPLPPGPLRDRLVTLGRLIGLRFREILVWHSGGLVVNAAVMGVVAPLRYVLITDAMIEQLDDRRIEAVFGHEAGHIKRHHIAFFLLYALISASIVTIAQARSTTLSADGRELLVAGISLLLAFKWTVLFAWISRQFERQADLFGVDTLVRSGIECSVPCAVHAPGPDGPSRGRPVCRTAAHVFGETLYDVARLNGIAPESGSWRHGSIASRATLLLKFADDPAAAAAFERRLRVMKVLILLAALVLAAWAAAELEIGAWFGG